MRVFCELRHERAPMERQGVLPYDFLCTVDGCPGRVAVSAMWCSTEGLPDKESYVGILTATGRLRVTKRP